jgi:replicative DNA helicase
MNEAPQFQSTLHEAAEEIRLQQIAIDQLRQQLEERTDQGAQLPDLEVVRDSEALRRSADRILSNLKLGTQSPQYKAARKALDQFIKALGSMEG